MRLRAGTPGFARAGGGARSASAHFRHALKEFQHQFAEQSIRLSSAPYSMARCFAKTEAASTNVTHVDEPTRVLLHRADHRRLRRIGADAIETIRAELRDTHLACWCAFPGRGEDDHGRAAIPLRIANA